LMTTRMAAPRSGPESTVTRVANGSIHRTPTVPVAVANGELMPKVNYTNDGQAT
jgi:hypothetical protein